MNWELLIRLADLGSTAVLAVALLMAVRTFLRDIVATQREIASAQRDLAAQINNHASDIHAAIERTASAQELLVKALLGGKTTRATRRP